MADKPVVDGIAEVGKRARDLRICYCAFPFSAKGVFIHELTMASMLRRAGCKLSVIVPKMPEDASFDEGVDVVNLKVTQRYIRELNQPRWLSVLKWPLKYIAQQIEMSYHLVRLSGKTDVYVFGAGPHFFLPAILARLLRKKIVKYAPGGPTYAFSSSIVKSLSKLSLNYWAYLIISRLEETVNALSHQIVIPVRDSISRVGMQKWQGKISAAMYMGVDDIFREKKDWYDRKDIIGYVGRLVEVKGVLQLVQAIPLILQHKKNARFLIVGDGVLMTEMKGYLEKAGCLDMVTFVGWVPNETLPDYLNEMKFHILPSYFESPGAINLEAMACGTIAIANNAGGIPDVVIDNKTGFLFKDNGPRTIADKILEVWESPELDKIRENAHIFVEQNYTCQKVADSWRRILDQL